ncbi:MAG: hypothetical protein EOM14_11210 [Clostridia bacterium]|nr:hypothetical protein [Clostridia bacterium]
MNYFYGLKHPIYTIVIASMVFALAYGNHTLAVADVSDAANAAFAQIKDTDLAALCIVSELETVYGSGDGWQGENFPGVTIKVELSTLPKCPRCWTHSATIGQSEAHPELCARCAAAI